MVNFLKKIVDDKGKPIPVIFRPLHEIEGGWFWWTCTTGPTKTIAPSKLIALCEAEGLPDPAKSFTDPKYAPWLYCMPWFSHQYTDNTAGATRNLCDWNKVQPKSEYVVKAGDFVITASNTVPAFDKSKLHIYPNPVTNGVVTIENFDWLHQGIMQVSIFDLTGRMVQQNYFPVNSDEKNIALNALKSGIYLLECRTGNFRQVEKLSINTNY